MRGSIGGKEWGKSARPLFSMSSLTRCVHLNPPQRIETPRVQCSGDLIAVPADPSHLIKTTASSILARSRFFVFFLFSFSFLWRTPQRADGIDEPRFKGKMKLEPRWNTGQRINCIIFFTWRVIKLNLCLQFLMAVFEFQDEYISSFEIKVLPPT